MPKKVEILDAEASNSTGVTFNFKCPLTVGDSFQNNDLRVVFVGVTYDTVNSSPPYTWSSWTSGWNLTYPAGNPTGSIGFTAFTKKLVPGDVDGRAALSFTTLRSPVLTYFSAFTVRNWDPTQTLTVVAGTGNSSGSGNPASYTVTAPSVSVTAGGILICWFGSLADGMSGIPTGMTSLADDGSHGLHYNPDPEVTPQYGPSNVLCGQAYSTSGTSGTKALTAVHDSGQGGTGYLSGAVSMFIKQAPDLNMNVGTATETDTASAVTMSKPALTTMTVGTAFETDTAFAVIDPCWGQHTRVPEFLDGNPVLNSRIEWTTSTPAAGSTAIVETSIDGGVTWQMPVNGGPIPGLLKGNTTCTVVLARETLHRVNASDTSPSIPTFEMEISVDDSEDELVPLGLFVVTDTEMGECGGNSSSTNSSGNSNAGNGVNGEGGTSTGGGRAVTLTAVDLSYEVARHTYTDVYYAQAGDNYVDVMAELVQTVLPGVAMNLSTTPHQIEETLVFGSQQGNDRWGDVQGLAGAVGFEAFFDSYGAFTVREVPDVTAVLPVWIFSDGTDGTNQCVSEFDHAMTSQTTYNYVIVEGETTDDTPPIQSIAFNNDPTSPLYYLGKFGTIPTIFTSPMIFSQAQADQVSAAYLRAVDGAGDTVTLSCVPMAALEPGDVFTAIRPSSGISGNFKFNQGSISMGPAGAMTVVGYRLTTS